MNESVRQALKTTLRNWNSMSGSGEDEAESTAEQFEASFYQFIDAVREMYQDIQPKPPTWEAFMELPVIKEIVEQLPGPLQLNFETETELIFENKCRIDEDKYD